MNSDAILIADGKTRHLSRDEALAYRGPGFVWLHLEGGDDEDLVNIRRQDDIPEVAASALVASETRPRCDKIEAGALINLRGLAVEDHDDSDQLVSIRIWALAGRVYSVTRRPLAAMATVIEKMEAGRIRDPGDLVAAFAWAISTQLDPEVADLGDTLDESETGLDSGNIYGMRREIGMIRSTAISYRRFVAPDRDALQTLAGLDVHWLAEDDRLHIREAADRFARMAEELEAVRERAALIHEQLTDLRSEKVDQRSLYIAVVAFIFLPLTFITGLLGMNVDGIPFAHDRWAFWGVCTFCVAVGVAVFAWFARRRWLRS